MLLCFDNEVLQIRKLRLNFQLLIPCKITGEVGEMFGRNRPRSNDLCSQCIFYISDMFLCFETTALPMQLGSKMEDIFRTF